MSAPPHNGSGSAPGQSPYQDRLTEFCRLQNIRSPNYQIVSDRRGGRTAWSCVVTVQGTSISAQFWYDGQFVNNAREDAAQRALRTFGVLPPAPGPQGQSHQHPGPQQQGQFFGAINTSTGN